ncbi:MAG: exo-alpha-sialidase [Deltaproteobacteria bacterium]|nr:exo-alpha-sialidase [Deltaproteobacteria bacterium]
MRARRGGASLALLALLALAPSRAVGAPAAAAVWGPVVHVPSPAGRSATRGGIAVDRENRVHVVFSVSDQAAWRRYKQEGLSHRPSYETMGYAFFDGTQWLDRSPVAPQQRRVLRGALAVDDDDLLHVLFTYAPGFYDDLFYRHAPASEGLRLGGWQGTQPVNLRGSSAMGDIAVYDRAVFLVFDDAGSLEAECKGCGDIFFRRSLDGGVSWEDPLDLKESPIGSSRPRIIADRAGVLFVTWDEGWNAQSVSGAPQYGIFMSSADQVRHWSQPLRITQSPQDDNVQLSVASDSRGGVLLVWRTAFSADPAVYFQWSIDWGETWTAPGRVPNLIPPPWDAPFDVYSIATDSAGRFHLLAVGVNRERSASGRALFHLTWDGEAWTSPIAVYDADGFPEFPQLVVGKQNDLHASWSVVFRGDGERSSTLLYAHAKLADSNSMARSATLRRQIDDYVPLAIPARTATTYNVSDVFDWSVFGRAAASLLAGGLIVAAVDGVRRLWSDG